MLVTEEDDANDGGDDRRFGMGLLREVTCVAGIGDSKIFNFSMRPAYLCMYIKKKRRTEHEIGCLLLV
jgi:hypothetical protein